MRNLSFTTAAITLSLCLAGSAQQPRLKTYKDPNYGVSFRYPGSWIRSERVDLMMGTWILDRQNGADQDPATAIVQYAGRDSRSNDPDHNFGLLSAALFTYLVLPHSTAEACRQRIASAANGQEMDTELIHGVTFQHVSAGDVAAGSEASRELYSAYLQDHCYLFEAAIHTYNGASRKRSPQIDALENRLSGIMQSVTIDPARSSAFHVEETTIAETHAAIRAGKTICRQLAETYLKRIAAYDQTTRLNTVVTLNPTVLADADKLDRDFRQTHTLRPLQCIAVVVKDNYDTKGLQTTGGSLAMKGVVPNSDTFMVKRLREAGALILFKSNMAEWAFSPVVTESSIAGITRNPYALDRVPAGSSGGTAASVAANLAEVGIGTDTGDSIRGPASHNDLVGIRPTIGLTSRDGIIPLNMMADVGGPLARTVADAAAVLSVVAGYDPADPITKLAETHNQDYTKFLDKNGLKGAKIGVFRPYVDASTGDPEIKTLTAQAIADLKAQGAIIIDPFVIPDFDALTKNLGCGDFQKDLNEYLAVHAPTAPYKSLQAIVDSGLYLPSIETRLKRPLDPKNAPKEPCKDTYHDERKIAFRNAIIAAMDAAGVDAILYPTWSNPPRLVGDLKSPGGDNNQVISPQSGLPAITVPMGFTHGTLPAGLQLLGRPFSEPTLIKLGYAYEQATQHRKPPPLFGPLP